LRLPATILALVIILSALIFAQYPASGGTAQTPLVIAEGAAARALAISAIDPHSAIFLTNAAMPNRIFSFAAVSAAPASVPGSPSAAGRLAAFAGTGAAGSLGDGGTALSAEFSLSPDSLIERSAVAVAPDGTIYVADTQNSTIRAIASAASTEPGVIRSVAGRWAPAQNVALTEPMGIAVDRAGDLFIADHAAGSIDEMAAGSAKLQILAHVISPASIAVTPDGSKVFVASPETGAVFAINTATLAIDVVPGFAADASSQASSSETTSSNATASSNTTTSSSRPCSAVTGTSAASTAATPLAMAVATTIATASAAQICPAGIAVDGAANLFVSDANTGRILRVDARSAATTVSATGLQTPGAIMFDASGNLYIAEQGAQRVVAMLQAGAGASGISIAPASASYINEPLGGNTAGQLFTLTNSSSSAIAGLNFVVGGTDPADFPIQGKSCLPTLAANSSCTVNVAFVPQAVGARSATLTATDSVLTDSAGAGLSGTGDDFQMSIPANQPAEISVQAGGTATFTAQVIPDGTFGAKGEKVVFVCPTNLPANTTCSFNPTSVSAKPSTPVTFQLSFVTTNILGTTGSFPFSSVPMNPASFLQGPRGGGPSGPARLPIGRPARTRRFQQIRDEIQRFPALPALAGLLALGAASLAFPWRRRRLISTLAFGLLSVAALAGCKHNKNTSLETPAGTTAMTVQGNAVDANGNPLNASRSVTITLVVTSD